jgi:hypothetical protein
MCQSKLLNCNANLWTVRELLHRRLLVEGDAGVECGAAQSHQVLARIERTAGLLQRAREERRRHAAGTQIVAIQKADARPNLGRPRPQLCVSGPPALDAPPP